MNPHQPAVGSAPHLRLVPPVHTPAVRRARTWSEPPVTVSAHTGTCARFRREWPRLLRRPRCGRRSRKASTKSCSSSRSTASPGRTSSRYGGFRVLGLTDGSGLIRVDRGSTQRHPHVAVLPIRHRIGKAEGTIIACFLDKGLVSFHTYDPFPMC